MELTNILASLRRSKLGAALVALQVALTVAIVSIAVHIGAQSLQRLRQPTGVDERNLFSMSNQWTGLQENLLARVQADLQLIRSTPDVVSATATRFLPLMMESTEAYAVGRRLMMPGVPGSAPIPAAGYWADEQFINTLGLHLVAGRVFRPEEIIRAVTRPSQFSQVIISQSLAHRLFPEGNALGGTFFLGPAPTTVIGVVERLAAAGPPALDPRSESFDYSLMVPFVRPSAGLYAVRTRPGRLNAVMREVERRLRASDPRRVLSTPRPFAEIKSEGLKPIRAVTVMFVSVSLLLVIVTGLAIVGISSYWTTQRRRFIGLRRALGARRIDIVKFYLTENLIIVGSGVLLGVVLAQLLSLSLMKLNAMQRAEFTYILGAATLVLLLGQFAALWPALRAASIPPALATRSS
jgi:putative ABC transport system permease protein